MPVTQVGTEVSPLCIARPQEGRGPHFFHPPRSAITFDK